MHVRIVGAGWAGLAAAIAACQRGWQVTLMDASHQAGGRAKRITSPNASHAFDNGQHILIGAYRDTRRLMHTVGVDERAVLMRLPLDLRDVQGHGLQLPDGPKPLNVLAGLWRARGWSGQDKWRLFKAATAWQWRGFTCAPDWTVRQLCEAHQLTPNLIDTLIEPLCLSALNTAIHEASAAVFLRVLHDALFSERRGSDFLIPKADLSAVFPDAALNWLIARGVDWQSGQSVDAQTLTQMLPSPTSSVRPREAVVLATSARQAALLTTDLAPAWSACAQGLSPRAIATVYLRVRDDSFQGLVRPMLALKNGPAQFVFCRQQLMGHEGVIAAVVSDCLLPRAALGTQVSAQIQQQLGLRHLEVLQILVDKHATFACTPQLSRPSGQIANGLWACGDYIAGPYPSTLEGAVRSGLQVIAQIAQMHEA